MNDNRPPIGEQATHVGMDRVLEVFGSVSWAWPEWIPNGYVSLLVGETGVGKSYLAAALIAAFTGARKLPDGARAHSTGPVVLVETEDMRGPFAERLLLLGVGLQGVRILAPDLTVHYTPTLDGDAQRLAHVAYETDAVAIVVDSLAGGHTLDENSSEMKRVLTALGKLAATTGVPVVAVHHLRKKGQWDSGKATLDRVRGSNTITQFARSVLGLWVPDEESGTVRVDCLKASFARKPPAFGFNITGAGVEYCEAPSERASASPRDAAADFLRQALSDGPRPSADLRAEAEKAGIAKNTLYRAAEPVGVVTENGLWRLREPAAPSH